MHLPNYKFQPDEELQKTQATMAPLRVKNGGLGIIITVLALFADFYQVSYFLMYTNSSSELAFLNAAFIVLGLDVSMFCLARNVNRALITKKGLRDKGFLAVAGISVGIFLVSFIAFLLLATSVMAANDDSVYGFQLLFPALTSAVSFLFSVNYCAREMRAQELRKQVSLLDEDLASAENKVKQAETSAREFDRFKFTRLSLQQDFETLITMARDADLTAHTMLANELGSEAAADKLLEEAGLTSEFWNDLRAKLESFSEEDFVKLDPTRVTNWTTADRKQPTLIPALPDSAALDEMTA